MTLPLITVLTYSRVQMIAAVFCSIIIAGLFTSSFFRILPSIGICGLTLTAILYAIVNRQIYQKPVWKVYLSLTVVFLLHLLSGLNTELENRDDYWRDVLLQSPFLLLPLAFWLLPPLKSYHLRQLWLLFFVLVVLFAIGSTINYLLNAENINKVYLHSQVMPTEPDHIRFSLMISLAIVVGTVMVVRKALLSNKRRELILVCTVFLAFYQHLLAVRSGLLTFYTVGTLTVIWLFFVVKQYRVALRLSICLILLPVLSFVCFPTFRNKFHNTREDLGQVDQIHSANNYSLTGRVYSYKIAMLLVEEHFWLGVGNADMEQELANKYRVVFPTIKASSYIKPHNQFIYSLVAFGLIGVLLFIACFYYPFVWAWPKHAPLLFAHYCIITLSFLVEYTLETQIGLTFTLMFLLLALSGLTSKAEPESGWRPA